MGKKPLTKSYTLIPADPPAEQVKGPDGNTYIIPRFNLRDKNGEVYALKTALGPIPVVVSGDPLNVTVESPIIAPGAQRLII